MVVDYIPRNLVQLQIVDSSELRALTSGKPAAATDNSSSAGSGGGSSNQQSANSSSSQSSQKAGALLTLLQSQAENKTVEWLITFQRWEQLKLTLRFI